MKALISTASGYTVDGPLGHDEAQDLWPNFLELLSKALGADGVCLHIIQRQRYVKSWCWGVDIALPSVITLNRMRNERVYSSVDMPDYTCSGSVRALRWLNGPDSFAALILIRSGRDFRTAEAAQLSRLAPYLSTVMVGWQSLDRERSRAVLERQMAQNLGAYWLRLSVSGRVIEEASGLQKCLATLSSVQLQPNGWLAFADITIAQAFRNALSEGPRGSETWSVVELSREPPAQLLVLAEISADTGERTALLRLGPRAQSLPAEAIARHFGLNLSEARLASLLCDGFTLQAAAHELGWTLETVRSCSKQIFARMGVNSQSSVIRKILGSAVWLS